MHAAPRHTCTALAALWLAIWALGPGPAQAQTTPAAGTPPAADPGTVGQPPFPTGQGPGYHSPMSAIKPLQEREGVVSWKLLSAVTTKAVKGRLEPIYPAEVKALNQQVVKVQGFMLPLEAGLKQQHFVLSSVPTTCPYCVPAGPEGLIEVKAKAPVTYGTEGITLQGRLHVLVNDPMGLYYRLTDATVAP